MSESKTSIPERAIQHFLNKDEIHMQLNARFKTVTPFTPVKAKLPHKRLQIDLMDMSKESDRGFKYILTTLDVFSRFVWLYALKRKKSSLVASKLEYFFSIFGITQIVQSDQGGEILGKVTSLLKRLNIKKVRSRPYHPQS